MVKDERGVREMAESVGAWVKVWAGRISAAGIGGCGDWDGWGFEWGEGC